MTDPIADMLTRIRNGQKARMVSVSMPASKAKEAVVKVLKDEGYITSYSTEGEGATSTLSVELKYFDGVPVIERIQRASSPGLRVYRGKQDLPSQNYVDVRVGYTAEALEVRASVVDYYLWYDSSSSPGDLTTVQDLQ